MPVDESYRKQVSLLIKIVPLVAKEAVFALKGGTAINLFLRNMPRLSVGPRGGAGRKSTPAGRGTEWPSKSILVAAALQRRRNR